MTAKPKKKQNAVPNTKAKSNTRMTMPAPKKAAPKNSRRSAATNNQTTRSPKSPKSPKPKAANVRAPKKNHKNSMPKILPTTEVKKRNQIIPKPTPDLEEPSAVELEKEVAAVAKKAATPEPVPAGIRQTYDGDTAFHLYLREIGQVPLLTPQEEVVLAERINKGDELAREQMIKANLRLVVKIARDFEGCGLPLLDLINEGNIGLMKGVERFDPQKGAKLSTYAAWWIKQSIKRALANQSKTIRLPVHVVDKLFNLRRTVAKMHEELGREPTDEELSAEVNVPIHKIAQMRNAAIRPASLDAPLGDEEDSRRISDIVADEGASSPYQQLENATVTAMLHDMVGALPPREADILRFRFGLDGEGEKTLEEVGEKFGVTRERIRQIQNIALAKLRKKIEQLEASKVAA